MENEKKDLETKRNSKIEIAYDFDHPLDFSLYKITSTYEEKNTKKDIKINFDKVDEYRIQITKYFKNINHELTKIMSKFTKLKSVVKDTNEIDLIIKSCKKKIVLNENKIEKLQEAINTDIKEIIISSQKEQQELRKRVTELEQLMAAQIIFNNNVNTKVQEQLKSKT